MISKFNHTTSPEMFRAMLKSALEHRFPEHEIVENETVKFNDQKLHGLSIRTPESSIAPTFYAEGYYPDFLAGRDMRDIVEEIAFNATRAVIPPEIDKGDRPDFSLEKIGSKLALRICEIDRNRLYLKDKPYKPVGCGLALFCVIDEAQYAVVINNSMAKEWEYDMDEVFRLAEKNSHPVLARLEDKIYGAEKNLLAETEEEPDAGPYVLTNEEMVQGASAFFLPGIKEKLCAMIGREFYVLPSSIHELILWPGENADEDALKIMVKQANRTVVDEKDVLSDNVFLCREAELTTV